MVVVKANMVTKPNRRCPRLSDGGPEWHAGAACSYLGLLLDAQLVHITSILIGALRILAIGNDLAASHCQAALLIGDGASGLPGLEDPHVGAGVE